MAVSQRSNAVGLGQHDAALPADHAVEQVAGQVGELEFGRQELRRAEPGRVAAAFPSPGPRRASPAAWR